MNGLQLDRRKPIRKMHREHRRQHHEPQRNTEGKDKGTGHDRYSANELEQRGDPRHQGRKRNTHRTEDHRESVRSSAEFRIAVSRKTKAEHQSKRQEGPSLAIHWQSLAHLQIDEVTRPEYAMRRVGARSRVTTDADRL